MNDREILRDLAKQVRDIAQKDVMDERRGLWRDHNSLRPTRPLYIARATRYAFFETELCPPKTLKCQDPLLRDAEFDLHAKIYQDQINDDSVIEPWLSVQAVQKGEDFGLVTGHVYTQESAREAAGGYNRMAYRIVPPLKGGEDVDKIRVPRHEIDYEETKRRAEKLRDAIGDILTVDVRYTPLFTGFGADISTSLAQFLGMENMMLFMYEEPEWLHALLEKMASGIAKVQEEAEIAGDYSLTAGENQSMCYAHELRDPAPNARGMKRKELWGFFAAQEYAQVSPAMHEEFLWNYQLPIMEKYGLTAYGCCEDLTRKIAMLRQLKNLRRVAVTPWANVRQCAEQLGRDYVLSWRPNPSDQICAGLDEAFVRKSIAQGLEDAKGCVIDITLKDVQTVGGDPNRLIRWSQIVRDVVEGR